MKTINNIYIYEHKYNDFIYDTYFIDKISYLDKEQIIIRSKNKHPNGVLAVIEYDPRHGIYESPLLSWKNLINCSRSYLDFVDTKYMNYTVQNGLKPSATAYPSSYEEYKHILDTLPIDCIALPYDNVEFDKYPTMLYIYKKGSLADYFDFDIIKEIYISHGIFDVDWDIFKEWFYKDMSYFNSVKESGVNIQGSVKKEETMIVGLLLGYPVESTISLFKKNTKVFDVSILKGKIRMKEIYQDRFKQDIEPYYTIGGKIIINGQEESNYYHS